MMFSKQLNAKYRIAILTIGFIATASLEARTPPPKEDNNPSADFAYTQDGSSCPYRKFHPGMKISHEHCVLTRSTQ